MSLGIGAFCKLIAQDESTAIYQYGSYNYNDERFINEEKNADGTITINKSALIEPEIRNKIKRFPNGKKKLIIKRIPREIPLSDLLENKLVIVENCLNCWETHENDIDVMASTIIFYIFLEYQEKGQLPESFSVNK